jgi:transcription elongation factor Elf1
MNTTPLSLTCKRCGAEYLFVVKVKVGTAEHMIDHPCETCGDAFLLPGKVVSTEIIEKGNWKGKTP